MTNIYDLPDSGVPLSDEALRALASLPPEHAAELVDFVADSGQDIRDPSNYIAFTVSKGFVSRRGQGGGQGPGDLPPEPPPVVRRDVVKPSRRLDPIGGHGAPTGASFTPSSQRQPPAPEPPPPVNVGAGVPVAKPNMIPNNATALEMRLLNLNSMDLWEGQQIDLISFMALRCLREPEAMDILENFEAKSRKTIIESPNNYVQATVSKILKGAGKGAFAEDKGKGKGKGGKDKDKGKDKEGYGKASGKDKDKDAGKNLTGNKSTQRALELGLELSNAAQSALSAMSLRDAFDLLDGAVLAAATGDDASQHILRATRGASGQERRSRPY